MRRSNALTKTLHLHAVVLHRAAQLAQDPKQQTEAEDRLDFMEALCRDTLETITEIRSIPDQQEFAADVLDDLAQLPVT